MGRMFHGRNQVFLKGGLPGRKSSFGISEKGAFLPVAFVFHTVYAAYVFMDNQELCLWYLHN